MKKFSLIKVGNHWYAGLEHSYDDKMNFNLKIDRILNVLDNSHCGELTVEFEELGTIVEGINILYFDEEDIVRYLTTNDYFEMRFVLNDREYTISSDFYWFLENTFNFNFHKTIYKLHFY